jgi:hypothetical protein
MAAARRTEPGLAPLLARLQAYSGIRRLAAHGVLTGAGEVLTYCLYSPGKKQRLVLETVSIERAELKQLAGGLETLVEEMEAARG